MADLMVVSIVADWKVDLMSNSMIGLMVDQMVDQMAGLKEASTKAYSTAERLVALMALLKDMMMVD